MCFPVSSGSSTDCCNVARQQLLHAVDGDRRHHDQLHLSCRATGATALARLGAPTADELGYAKALGVSEIGGTTVVVLEQDASAGAVSTVVLRASTDQLLDDLERAIDDGVNTYKVLAPAALLLVPAVCERLLSCYACQYVLIRQQGLARHHHLPL